MEWNERFVCVCWFVNCVRQRRGGIILYGSCIAIILNKLLYYIIWWVEYVLLVRCLFVYSPHQLCYTSTSVHVHVHAAKAFIKVSHTKTTLNYQSQPSHSK